MKFCPKCGGPMVPVKKGENKIILKCQRCGYEMPAPKEIIESYRAVHKTRKEEKIISTKVIAKVEKSAVSKEDIEQAKEEYYELVLDQIGEYGD